MRFLKTEYFSYDEGLLFSLKKNHAKVQILQEVLMHLYILRKTLVRRPLEDLCLMSSITSTKKESWDDMILQHLEYLFSHTFWLLNVWEVKVEIRFCIEEYVHSLFGKNSENSHFSTFNHVAGSGRKHNVSSERGALSLS